MTHDLLESNMTLLFIISFGLLDPDCNPIFTLQVKVWFQNRRMKWRHQEEAKRKKEEEDSKKPEEERGISGDVRSPLSTMDTAGDESTSMIVDEEDDSDIDVDDDSDADMVGRCMHQFRLNPDCDDGAADDDRRSTGADTQEQIVALNLGKRSDFSDNLDNSIGILEHKTTGVNGVQ